MLCKLVHYFYSTDPFHLEKTVYDLKVRHAHVEWTQKTAVHHLNEVTQILAPYTTYYSYTSHLPQYFQYHIPFMYQQVPLPQNLTLYMYQPCTPSTSLTPDTQEPHATAHSPVEPLPLRSSTSQTALPSSEINENKAGTLINKVALEATFGKDVMRRCTPLGSRDLPALSPRVLQF